MSAADDVENWLNNYLSVTRAWGPGVRFAADDGHTAVVAAVVEWVDGFDVYVATATVGPGNGTMDFTLITDDRGGRYRINGGSGSGGSPRARWLASFEPALDPLAKELRLYSREAATADETDDFEPLVIVPVPERT